MPEDMIDTDLIELGRDRSRQMAEVPKMAIRIGQLERELAECRAAAFNTTQYRDTVRRCSDACNETADLRKLVNELKAEIHNLRSQLKAVGGGYPPVGVPGEIVANHPYEGG